MTKDEHRARHIYLHAALDELLADYIRHHPHDGAGYLSMPVRGLMDWSLRQTVEPSEVSHADPFETQ